ncbi:BLUF domain-containing protein [Pseudorhodoplanes sp.]|uniref:BLUF domain-containing protein n=1 Tax=Pseudorhodoplanes sp. TaxID=1934341 RepID=UPI0039187DE8
MLVRCLYASRPAQPLKSELLDGILEQSRRNNPPRGITGLLSFTNDVFVQVIEGGRDEVCDLFNTLVRDDRHRHVRLLSYEEVGERRFPAWSMGQVNVGSLNRALLLKYSQKAVLDPFTMPGQATMALLSELVATGAIATRTGGPSH